MFLVIEWIDASWKSTQVQLLSEKLIKLWKSVHIIDFPRYDEKSSFFVKKYLAWDYGKIVSAEMSSLFFALDRYDASFQFQEYIQKYDFVIANRYVSSNMIHHGCKIEERGARQKFLDWLENLEYEICSIPRPDKIFFLSLSLENNFKLIQKRAFEKARTELDLHEGNNEYLKKAWNTAQEISLAYGWEKIECEKDGKILEREYITDIILEKIF